MEGPHELTVSNVNDHVDHDVGVYTLYRTRDGPVRFVGMSTDLAERIKDHADDYPYFEYEHHPNRTEAYEREAQLFHQHGGRDDLDNGQHPPRPHKQVTCPACGIHD